MIADNSDPVNRDEQQAVNIKQFQAKTGQKWHMAGKKKKKSYIYTHDIAQKHRKTAERAGRVPPEKL